MSHSPALTDRLTRLRGRLARGQPAIDPDPGLLWAAVSVILAPDPEAILLIRRAERMGDPWSGHMALPGGRREPGDGDLLATAVRETSEEVGLKLSANELAGILDDVVPRTPVLPPIAVRPFVFITPARPSLVLSPEVASAGWIGIDDFLHPTSHGPVRLALEGGGREVPAFRLGEAIVWGMTERILSDLFERLGY